MPNNIVQGEHDWYQLPPAPTQTSMGFPAPPMHVNKNGQRKPGIDPQLLMRALLGQNNHGGLLNDQDMQRARQQALMSMGASLLQSSGPSPTRIPFGQALGSSIMAGQQAQRSAEQDALQALVLKTKLQQKEKPKRYVVNGALVDDEGRPVYTAPAAVKPPETRTINRGGETITQEFDPAKGSWTDIAKAPRWEANTSGGGQKDPPAGYAWTPNGQLAHIPGGPADPSLKPTARPTEAAQKAGMLIKGMQDAEAQIEVAAKETDPTGKWNAVMGAVPFTGGSFQSDDYRAYNAAAERWASNYLYLKSGAQAGKDEITSTVRQFFPRTGEDDRIVKQKAAARKQEMDNATAVYMQGQSAPDAPLQRQGIDEAGYNSLPSGTQYRAPDGSIRTKR